MLRRSRSSFLGTFCSSLLALHCGSAPDTGSLIGDGAGGTGAASAGGGPSIGGAFGINSGLGGHFFGWEEADAGAGSSPDGGVLALEGCGDDVVQSGEACDDGNSASGDGCSATCGALEQDFACLTPGEACVNTVECGDGDVTGDELCDDRNQANGDGCSSDCREVEAGWACSVAGLRCAAAACGDGVVAGVEECDFVGSMTGCTLCKIDDGMDCDSATCAVTVCGNGFVERGEQCEDGNELPFDGCFNCRLEPACNNGVCTAVCGDGQRFDNEACDDGNSRSGDGCSATCAVEQGYACTPAVGAPPLALSLPVVFRDFIGQGNSLKEAGTCQNPVTLQPPGATDLCFHIDFNGLGGSGIPNVVEAQLGVDGRPVYRCPGGSCDPNDQNPGHLFTASGNTRPNFNGPAAFAEWYDSSSPNAIQVLKTFSLNSTPQGTYVYDATDSFYPLDDAGWVASGHESLAAAAPCNHNVSFTSETHFWFEYQGGERFDFAGDDDLWVFVNGKLVLDLGGLHVSQPASFLLDADVDGDQPGDVADGTATVTGPHVAVGAPNQDLGLTVGGVYEIALFHAERNECGSNFKVTLKDFNKPKSVCTSFCGDGVVASDELCDDGAANNDGTYGKCAPNCLSRGPNCGDGEVQASDAEACDDGQNLNGYGSGCAPGCKLPASCGDGEINGVFGEECDDGVNDGSYEGCTPDCQLAPRCGDGAAQGTEACDDGNLLSGDGCSSQCADEQPR